MESFISHSLPLSVRLPSGAMLTAPPSRNTLSAVRTAFKSESDLLLGMGLTSQRISGETFRLNKSSEAKKYSGLLNDAATKNGSIVAW